MVLRTSLCLPESWLAAQRALRPRDTQQLGRERLLPSSLPRLRFILMAMTSPLGTELSRSTAPATLALVPLLLPAREERNPAAWGSPSASERGDPNDGKLYYKDNCCLNAKGLPPCIGMKPFTLLLSNLVFLLNFWRKVEQSTLTHSIRRSTL